MSSNGSVKFRIKRESVSNGKRTVVTIARLHSDFRTQDFFPLPHVMHSLSIGITPSAPVAEAKGFPYAFDLTF